LLCDTFKVKAACRSEDVAVLGVESFRECRDGFLADRRQCSARFEANVLVHIGKRRNEGRNTVGGGSPESTQRGRCLPPSAAVRAFQRGDEFLQLLAGSGVLAGVRLCLGKV
jgi:hypothetical protein